MIPIKSVPSKEAAMPTEKAKIWIEGLVAEASSKLKNHGRMPQAPFPGVKISLSGGTDKQFQSCILMLLNDPGVFETFIDLTYRGVFVDIVGPWGEWIYLAPSGNIVIRCDIGIQRVKRFFELDEEMP